MSDLVADSERETITLHELLDRCAQSALEFQQDDGSFPAGQNYDKNDQETAVRSTSHWLILLLHMYEITRKKKYEEPIHRAVDYLLSKHIRPNDHTFLCRISDEKDMCNGIVGQATPIKALVMAGEICNRKDTISTAEAVFDCIPFDQTLGLWKIVDVDGGIRSFDRTLNHQILFASNLCSLSNHSKDVETQISIFLSHLEDNMRLRKGGIIRHYVNPHGNLLYPGIKNKHLLRNKILETAYQFSSDRKAMEKRYHLVNLYGLGVLSTWFPEHPIWDNRKIQSALSFILQEDVYDQILDGDTAMGYTIPGIRAAWAIHGLSSNRQNSVRELVEADLDNKLDMNNWVLTSDKLSQEDQAPMISYLVGLPNMTISLTDADRIEQ